MFCFSWAPPCSKYLIVAVSISGSVFLEHLFLKNLRIADVTSLCPLGFHGWQFGLLLGSCSRYWDLFLSWGGWLFECFLLSSIQVHLLLGTTRVNTPLEREEIIPLGYSPGILYNLRFFINLQLLISAYYLIVSTFCIHSFSFIFPSCYHKATVAGCAVLPGVQNRISSLAGRGQKCQFVWQLLTSCYYFTFKS